MTSKMNYLQKYNKILGEEFGKANKKLLILYLFHLTEKYNKNTCYRCGNKIETSKELSVEHKKSWMPDGTNKNHKELYFLYSNCVYSHIHCNCASSKAFKGKSKYVGVDLFFDKRRNYKRWRSVLRADGIKYCLGYFEKEEDAAEARDLGVFKYNKGIGLLNFPERKEKYIEMIKNGWGEPLKCKKCGGKHYGLGYCRTCYYYNCGGKEKRKERYVAGKG